MVHAPTLNDTIIQSSYTVQQHRPCSLSKPKIVEFKQQIAQQNIRLWKAKQAQEAAMEMIEKECAKCRAAVVAASKNMIKGEDKEMIIAESKTTEVVITEDMVITDRSISDDTDTPRQFYPHV